MENPGSTAGRDGKNSETPESLAGIIISHGKTLDMQQRRKEFGIRAAIGATRNDLAVVVIRDGLRTAMAGTRACLVAMPFAGRLMASVVFGASPTDPAVFLGTPLVLLGAACLAAAAPALGVSRDVDVSTLREN